MLREKRALTALDAMSKRPFTVTADERVSEAAALMIRENIGSLPVVDAKGRLIGMLTERMFQAALSGIPRPFSIRSLQDRTTVRIWGGYNETPTSHVAAINDIQHDLVRDVMLKNPPFLAEDASLTDVAQAFFETHMSHLAVVRDGVVVGVMARHDLLRALAES